MNIFDLYETPEPFTVKQVFWILVFLTIIIPYIANFLWVCLSCNIEKKLKLKKLRKQNKSRHESKR